MRSSDPANSPEILSMVAQVRELLRGIREQERDDLDVLQLTAYDNRISKTAAALLASPLSQRYNLGTLESHGATDPAAMGEFLFKGLPKVYAFEKVAREAAREMFHAAASDFRPLSGMHAMMTTLATLTEPGETVASIECDFGGHFATRHVATRFGRRSTYIPVDPASLCIDLDAFRREIHAGGAPDLVYFDIGCPLFPVPLAEVRAIVGPDIPIVYDGSHTLGLIAGGAFQSPLEEGADVLQGNTHKTFPGPQKGMIHFRSAGMAERLADALTAGLVSSQHTHHSIALYLTIFEMQAFGRDYARQTLANAQALAAALVAEGFDLLGRGGEYTRSNVLLLRGTPSVGHVEACRRLYACNIATNSRHGFGEEVVRLGVQEATRRGMREAEMNTIAGFFRKALIDGAPLERLKGEVIAFSRSFPDIHYSFDAMLGGGAEV